MPFIHLAQDPTPIPDSQVAEVVVQATKAIDAFSDLGVFLAVLFVFALLIILFGSIVLVLVWSNRKTSGAAVNVLAQVNADKINELVEMRRQRDEENKLERERHQERHDQLMLMFGAITSRQTEGDAQVSGAVTSSEQTVKQAVTSSEGRIIDSVVASKDDVLAVLKLLGKVNTDVFQPVSSEPPDLAAMQSILEDTLAAIANNKKRMQTAPARATSEVPAVTLPAEVVITDVSPAAMETIKGAMMPVADAGAATDGESEDKIA